MGILSSNSNMIAIGIDPGSRRIGYGVVERNGVSLSLHDAGIFRISAREDIPALQETKQEIVKIISKVSPDIIALEKLFFVKNRTTGIQVAQARGVIITAAAESGIPIREFSPNEVKAGVTGYGLADKQAVAKMVRLILNEPRLEVIDDASDALAIAILALQKAAFG
jgi:crossover junction endodeoxyribonuclease RuvC